MTSAAGCKVVNNANEKQIEVKQNKKMASSLSPQVCWRPTCTKSTVSAPNKCPICKVTIYCSSKCRKDHRKEHKKECAEVGGREDVRLSKKLQEDVRLGKGSWKFAPEHSRLSAEEGAELMKLWANSMPPDRLSRFPAGTTPEQALDNLASYPTRVCARSRAGRLGCARSADRHGRSQRSGAQ